MQAEEVILVTPAPREMRVPRRFSNSRRAEGAFGRWCVSNPTGIAYGFGRQAVDPSC
jgi:hypothetical protein